MSMYLSSATTATAPEAKRLFMASALARYTSKRREQLGLTIARAAELSGLQISEWCGLEEGWVPEDMATLRAIADTLQVCWMDYNTLAFFAGCFQKCR